MKGPRLPVERSNDESECTVRREHRDATTLTLCLILRINDLQATSVFSYTPQWTSMAWRGSTLLVTITNYALLLLCPIPVPHFASKNYFRCFNFFLLGHAFRSFAVPLKPPLFPIFQETWYIFHASFHGVLVSANYSSASLPSKFH